MRKETDNKYDQILNILKNITMNNEKKKLPSQTEVNPKYNNSRGVNSCEDDNSNSVNLITTLRLGKKIDNNTGHSTNNMSLSTVDSSSP